MKQWEAGRAAADVIADRLATPDDARTWNLVQGWHPQSLAYGAAGVALLHIERARAGIGSWQRAHDWLACAAAGGAHGGLGSHLFHGAPALAFALHAASERRSGRYARALHVLDRAVAATAQGRLDAAHVRLGAGERPALAEYDTIRGLTGIGALLLRRATQLDLLRSVLAYLVRLTEPVKDEEGELLPGWWSALAPSGRPSPDFPGGHGNTGMAHGIGGPLALLSLAALRGVTVPRQDEAIRRICEWLDRWRQDGPAGAWWPYWIARDGLRTEQPGGGPSRPSWCYGTAGLARAQQLAGLALNDTARQHAAEEALLHAMTDPGHLDQIRDASLCHGWAGLVHLTHVVATDALTPGLEAVVPDLLDRLLAGGPTALADGLLNPADGPGDIGLLDGAAGVALALHTSQSSPSPDTTWNACFLIN